MIYNVCFLSNSKNERIVLNESDVMTLVNDMKPRELNIIGGIRRYTISNIVIKKKSFIIKLDYLKAIVKNEMVYIFDIDNRNVNEFANYLSTKLINKKDNETRFELKILDVMISHICLQYNSILDNILSEVMNLDEMLSLNNINISFNNIVTLQNKIINFQTRVTDVKNVIEELLDSDEDMANIYISKENNPITEHTEVEYLLENYQKNFQEILNEISGMLKDIDIRQRILDLNFASKRNNLASLNVKLTLLSLSVSVGTIITGIFGMNLQSKLENSFAAFISIIFLILLLIFIAHYFLTKIHSILLD